jgi:hypothetical protein
MKSIQTWQANVQQYQIWPQLCRYPNRFETVSDFANQLELFIRL